MGVDLQGHSAMEIFNSWLPSPKAMSNFLERPISLRTVGALALLWLVWRLWAFTLQPYLFPKRPRPLPYLIPWIGHAVTMSRDIGKVFKDGRSKFYRETYSLTVAGQVIYVVTSPNDISAIYRESTRLEYESVAKEAMKQFGWTSETVEKMFNSNGMAKHGVNQNHEDVKLQMHPGTMLEDLQNKFLEQIERLVLNQQAYDPAIVSNEKISTRSKTISLLPWCGHVMVEATIRAFFGNAIFSVFPNIVSDFFEWDTEAWKMHVGYPRFAARSMYNAKDRAFSALNEYLSLPLEERSDSVWLFRRFEERMNGLGVEAKDQQSALFLAMHRVINGNAYRHAFWLLSYLLHDPELLNDVRSETKKAFRADGILDMAYLLEECKLLASVHDESLRLCVDSMGIRVVSQELEIGGKTLSPGATILMPYRQGHFDPQVFGSNASDFDAYRFLKNKGLQRSTSWRPYGGGSTYCPGRFISRREVYMFVALALSRFDMRLVEDPRKSGKQRFPRMDDSVPTGGVVLPVSGDEVLVVLQNAK